MCSNLEGSQQLVSQRPLFPLAAERIINRTSREARRLIYRQVLPYFALAVVSLYESGTARRRSQRVESVEMKCIPRLVYINSMSTKFQLWSNGSVTALDRDNRLGYTYDQWDLISKAVRKEAAQQRRNQQRRQKLAKQKAETGQ